MKTVAIKIKTKAGERFFYGFGKGKSVKTAWSLAGAKLFTMDCMSRHEEVAKIKEVLKAKKKQFEVVDIGETPPAGLVWFTRDEFNHYGYINKMKPVNLDYLAQYADAQRQSAKEIMRSAFDAGDEENQEFFRQDAIEWALFSRMLNREIRKLGGL